MYSFFKQSFYNTRSDHGKVIMLFKLYYPLKPGKSVLYDKNSQEKSDIIGEKKSHCVSESLHLV